MNVIKNISTKSLTRVDIVSIKNVSYILKTYDKKHLTSEINILEKCNNENIIKYFRKFGDELYTYVFFIPEDMCLTDLILNYMYDKWCVIYQIMSGLHYLHINKIIHFDMKTDNIMYTNGIIKIIDFGSSQIMYDDSICILKSIGTVTHRPPEGFIITENKIADDRFDIWGLGIIMFEILNDIPMYMYEHFPAYDRSISDTVYLEFICSNKFTKNIRHEIPYEYSKCLELDFKKRPHICDLLMN